MIVRRACRWRVSRRGRKYFGLSVSRAGDAIPEVSNFSKTSQDLLAVVRAIIRVGGFAIVVDDEANDRVGDS